MEWEEELEGGQDGPVQGSEKEKELELEEEEQNGPMQGREELEEEDVIRLQELSQLKSSKVSNTQ